MIYPLALGFSAVLGALFPLRAWLWGLVILRAQIVVKEEAMADWLAANLPELTEEFLARDAGPSLEEQK